MKKLILLSILFLAFIPLKAQPPGIFGFVIIKDSLCMKSGGPIDSCITVIMKDTLVNPKWVRAYVLENAGFPGGSPGDLQYNNAGDFDGAPMTTDGTDITITNTLNVGIIEDPDSILVKPSGNEFKFKGGLMIVNETDTGAYLSDIPEPASTILNFKYSFEYGNTSPPPNLESIRFNNNTASSVTEVYVNNKDRDGYNINNILKQYDEGFLFINDQNDAGRGSLFSIDTAISSGLTVNDYVTYEVVWIQNGEDGALTDSRNVVFGLISNAGSSAKATPGGPSGSIQYNASGQFGGAPMTTDGTDITITNDGYLSGIYLTKFSAPQVLQFGVNLGGTTDPFYWNYINSTSGAIMRSNESLIQSKVNNATQATTLNLRTPVFGPYVLKSEINSGAQWDTKFKQIATLNPAIQNRVYIGTDSLSSEYTLLDTTGFYIGIDGDIDNPSPQYELKDEQFKITDGTGFFTWDWGLHPRIYHNWFTPTFAGMNFELDTIHFQIKNNFLFNNQFVLSMDTRLTGGQLFQFEASNSVWTYEERFSKNATTGGWILDIYRDAAPGTSTGIRADENDFNITMNASNTYKFEPDSATYTAKLNPKHFAGQIYMGTSSTVTIAATATWYTIDEFTTDLAINTTLTDSTITLGSLAYGLYELGCNLSTSYTGNNDLVEFAVFVNDVSAGKISSEFYNNNPGDPHPISLDGIGLADSGDVVKIKVRATGTGTLTVEYGNLYLIRH